MRKIFFLFLKKLFLAELKRYFNLLIKQFFRAVTYIWHRRRGVGVVYDQCYSCERRRRCRGWKRTVGLSSLLGLRIFRMLTVCPCESRAKTRRTDRPINALRLCVCCGNSGSSMACELFIFHHCYFNPRSLPRRRYVTVVIKVTLRSNVQVIMFEQSVDR